MSKSRGAHLSRVRLARSFPPAAEGVEARIHEVGHVESRRDGAGEDPGQDAAPASVGEGGDGKAGRGAKGVGGGLAGRGGEPKLEGAAAGGGRDAAAAEAAVAVAAAAAARAGRHRCRHEQREEKVRVHAHVPVVEIVVVVGVQLLVLRALRVVEEQLGGLRGRRAEWEACCTLPEHRRLEVLGEEELGHAGGGPEAREEAFEGGGVVVEAEGAREGVDI